jgi:DNA polymerase III subunit gamma/tau
MENFIVSARKYRPATFDTVVGQSAITNTLKNAIRNNQIAQAFLFTGPRGVGKTTCARILAKTINCSNISSDGEACDACQSCLSFNKTSSFNIFELDAASNNTVEDIRNLVDQVRIPPQQGYKVYIVDEVHMLSQAAFNAFLKTLEEPPAYAKFILATTEKHKILPTILSRCQIFDFRRISVDDIAQHLQFVADSEQISAEQEALHVIAQKADGGLRDALSMFDQLVSYAGNSLTYKQVIENLNVLDYEYYFKITDYILNTDISNTLLTINEIIENGFEGQHFITGFGQHLRNLLVSKDPVTLQLLETSNSIKEEYHNQSMRCSVQFLLEALEITNQGDIDYKTSNNKKLHIEITLLQLCKINMPLGNSTTAKTAQPVKPNPVTPPSVTNAPKDPEKPVQQIKQPPAETSQQVKPDQPATSPATSIQSNIPPPDKATSAKAAPSLSGMNISNLMSGKKPESKDSGGDGNDEVPGESYGSEHVSISDLLKVWPVMAEKLAKELPLLQHTLSWKNPDLDENLVIISIENPLQDDEVFRNKSDITLFLRKALRNDNIKVETRMIESTPEARRPYTDNEKFDFIAAKAPVLKIMKDQLGLELEM